VRPPAHGSFRTQKVCERASKYWQLQGECSPDDLAGGFLINLEAFSMDHGEDDPSQYFSD